MFEKILAVFFVVFACSACGGTQEEPDEAPARNYRRPRPAVETVPQVNQDPIDVKASVLSDLTMGEPYMDKRVHTRLAFVQKFPIDWSPAFASGWVGAMVVPAKEASSGGFVCRPGTQIVAVAKPDIAADLIDEMWGTFDVIGIVRKAEHNPQWPWIIQIESLKSLGTCVVPKS